MGTRVLASLLARRRPPHRPEGVTISEIDRFGPELEDFWPEAAKPFTLIQVCRPLAKENHCSRALLNGRAGISVPMRSRVRASFG